MKKPSRPPAKKKASVKTQYRGVSAPSKTTRKTSTPKPQKATTDHPSEALARLLTAAMGDDAVEVEWVIEKEVKPKKKRSL